MPNKYSYLGGRDLNGRMFVYEDEMKKYDLNSDAIRTFAKALRKGELENIKLEFEILDNGQKQGLLNLFIDYNDLFGDFMNLNAPMGRPIDLAKRFKHPEIVEYIAEQKSNLEKMTKESGYSVIFFGKQELMQAPKVGASDKEEKAKFSLTLKN